MREAPPLRETLGPLEHRRPLCSDRLGDVVACCAEVGVMKPLEAVGTGHWVHCALLSLGHALVEHRLLGPLCLPLALQSLGEDAAWLLEPVARWEQCFSLLSW